MSSKIFYVQKMKKLHSRYSLSANAVLLLKALDEYRMGSIDQAELGRIVRMSRNNRKAVTETISKCATMMEKKPEEVKDCIALIQNCTEILGVADEPHEVNLPFLKFPREIRQMIYGYYLLRRYPFALFPKKKNGNCACPRLIRSTWMSNTINLNLAYTCTTVKDELFAYFYQNDIFGFGCTCEMHHLLSTNKLLQMSLRFIKVDWYGALASKAFELLKTCPNLKELHITISRGTSNYLTPRQEKIMDFFPTQRRSARLCDSLGIDELLALRGLENVFVAHVKSTYGSRRSEEERSNLQALLRDVMLQSPSNNDQ